MHITHYSFNNSPGGISTINEGYCLVVIYTRAGGLMSLLQLSSMSKITEITTDPRIGINGTVLKVTKTGEYQFIVQNITDGSISFEVLVLGGYH